MRKGKDPDPGGLKTCGSGSSTLVYIYKMQYGTVHTYQMQLII
jgi:hypothetical protein